MIPTTELQKAQTVSANQLVLGYLLGGHEVWIDGERVFAGTYKSIRFPLIVGISTAR